MGTCDWCDPEICYDCDGDGFITDGDPEVDGAEGARSACPESCDAGLIELNKVCEKCMLDEIASIREDRDRDAGLCA